MATACARGKVFINVAVIATYLDAIWRRDACPSAHTVFFEHSGEDARIKVTGSLYNTVSLKLGLGRVQDTPTAVRERGLVLHQALVKAAFTYLIGVAVLEEVRSADTSVKIQPFDRGAQRQHAIVDRDGALRRNLIIMSIKTRRNPALAGFYRFAVRVEFLRAALLHGLEDRALSCSWSETDQARGQNEPTKR
jgi:hypothetical protein